MRSDSVFGVLIIALSLCWLVRSEQGSCPPTLPVDMCDAKCGPDRICDGEKLCCPTECGGAMCVDAVTKRRFVNLVASGRCPEYPRGPWICSHMCTSDGDCPNNRKCCTNRCGAQTCQRPDPEDGPIVPYPQPAWNENTVAYN